MGISDRRARHRASLRREILDAASRLFVEEGYAHVTMRRIAERIEYSPTTIYLHFKDKQALFGAVCEEAFAQLSAQLDRLRYTAKTPVGYLREALRAYVDFGAQHPDHYTAMFLTPANGPSDPAFEHTIAGRTLEALRQAVRASVESGQLRTADIEATSQALWAAVHGLTALAITTTGLPLVAHSALADHLVDTLLAGLQPPAPSPPRPRPQPSFID